MSANRDAPRGFRPVVGVGGSAGIRTTKYAWTSAAKRVGQHGLVIMAQGRASAYAAKSTAIIGVAAHFVSSAGTGRTVYVYDDPRQIFEAQINGSGAGVDTLAEALGGCLGVYNANSVNGTNSMSKEELTTTVGAWNTTNCMQVVDGGMQILNSQADSWTTFRVRIAPKSHVWAKDQPGNKSK